MGGAVGGVAALCGYPLFPVLCATVGRDIINYLRGMASTGTYDNVLCVHVQ